MNIAFYAPMKPPNHPQPSGDRLIARNTMAALELAGHKLTLASTLRSWEGLGDEKLQNNIKSRAVIEKDRLLAQWIKHQDKTPDLWFTYHCYHKSPDWLGPIISDHLGIPYVLMEASHARNKPRNTSWQQGLEQTRYAIATADLLISINRADMEGLDRVRSARSQHYYIPPFIDTTMGDILDTSQQRTADNVFTTHNPGKRLIVVAMMRNGDKLKSYKVLAEAMSKLKTIGWQLDIVGDGQTMTEIQALFERYSAANKSKQQEHNTVTFHGALRPADVASLMKQADYLVWPGINEALGMVYLEAQACGLPVIVGEMEGTADLVENHKSGWLVANPDADSIALAIDHALQLNPQQRINMRKAAVHYCYRQHSITAAAKQFDTAIKSIKRPPKVNA